MDCGTHNGTIEVESQPSMGSQFSINYPYNTEEKMRDKRWVFTIVLLIAATFAFVYVKGRYYLKNNNGCQQAECQNICI